MSDDNTATPFPLSVADKGVKVRIRAVRAGHGLALRLTELGLSTGTEIHMLQRQEGGLPIARGEDRIAVGRGMASKILVVPV
jgi:ferrous iron transport protein A